MRFEEANKQREREICPNHTHRDKPEGVSLKHCTTYQAHLTLRGNDVEVEVAYGVERWPVEAQPGSVR